METFKEFIKSQREKTGLNQSDFGQRLGIIMTDVSKIENGRKKFPFKKLETLASFINIDFELVKNKFVADKIVDEVYKYECTNKVYSVAEKQHNYLLQKNAEQAKLKL